MRSGFSEKMLQNNNWVAIRRIGRLLPPGRLLPIQKTHHLLTGQNESSLVIQCSKRRISHALDSDKAIGGAVSNRNRSSWQNRQAFAQTVGHL